MTSRGTKALLALAGAAVLAGCTHLVTRSLPKADIGHYKHIFVEHRLADSYGIADEMARQLGEMGYDASAGALTMMPSEAELIVSYEDMWTWDFNTYMIEIDVQVRSARTDKILAVGHYYRPSMVFGHPPAAMIHEMLVKLFKHG
ncbi:MAG TPA: hypothetical protein VN775_13605 [Opitutaceae bacterium]|nr:hypothetical protein [Opitutaceae bacterium]